MFSEQIDESTIDALVHIISKPIHQKKRHGVLKTHENFWGKNTTLNGALRKLIEYTLKRREGGDNPKVSYISTLATTLQRNTGIPKGIIKKSYLNLLRILNPENLDPVYYSGNLKFSIEKLPKGKIKVNESLPMYSKYEIRLFLNYCIDNLNNFLNANKYNKNIEIPQRYETLVFILLMITSGRRPNDIIHLDKEKIESLIITNNTVIKDKFGIGIDQVTIPPEITSILDRYINLLPPEQTAVFLYNYNKHYNEGLKIFRTIFGRGGKGKRIYASFRNFISGEGSDINKEVTRDLLGHRSTEMTDYYAKRQEMSNIINKKENLLSSIYKELVATNEATNLTFNEVFEKKDNEMKDKKKDEIRNEEINLKLKRRKNSKEISNMDVSVSPAASLASEKIINVDRGEPRRKRDKGNLKDDALQIDLSKIANQVNVNKLEVTKLKDKLKESKNALDNLNSLVNSRLDILGDTILMEQARKKYDDTLEKGKRVRFQDVDQDNQDVEMVDINLKIPPLAKVNSVEDKNLELVLLKLNNTIKALESKTERNMSILDDVLLRLQDIIIDQSVLNRQQLKIQKLNQSM